MEKQKARRKDERKTKRENIVDEARKFAARVSMLITRGELKYKFKLWNPEIFF